MDRRQFLTTTTLAASAALAPAAIRAQGKPAAPAATPGDAKLNALLETIFMNRVKRSPTFATGLGFDKEGNRTSGNGHRARLRRWQHHGEGGGECSGDASAFTDVAPDG